MGRYQNRFRQQKQKPTRIVMQEKVRSIETMRVVNLEWETVGERIYDIAEEAHR